MVMLTIVSILAGLVLGTRFKVFILYPVMLVGVAAIVAADVAHGGAGWGTFLKAVLNATGLQVGYLGSTVARVILARPRARRRDTAEGPVAASRPVG